MKQLAFSLFWLIFGFNPSNTDELTFNFHSIDWSYKQVIEYTEGKDIRTVQTEKSHKMIRKDQVIDYQLSIKNAETVYFSQNDSTTLTPARFVPVLSNEKRVMLDGNWQVIYWPFQQSEGSLLNGHGDEVWKDINQPGKVFYYNPEQSPAAIKNWNRVTQSHLDPEDGAIIRKEVTIPARWKDKCIKLRFEGLYPAGKIYWDGKLIGEQWSGLTPIEIDVTGFASPGTTHMLAVRFYRRHPAIQLDMPRHALDFVGLSRSAYLHVVEPLHVSDLRMQTELANDYATGSLSGEVVLLNSTDHKSDVTLNIQVADNSGMVVANRIMSVSIDAGKEVPFKLQLPVGHVEVWNDERPYLYNLTLQVICVNQSPQSLTSRIGFRRFELEKQQPLLNGKPVKFRGVNHLTFNPDGGMYTPEKWLRQCLTLMKRANVNTIRTHFFSPPELVDLCDEMGFYLMQELPIDWGTHYVQETSLLGPMLHRMEAGVRRDRNHPSVMVWSIGNENMPFTEDVYENFQLHLKLCKEMVKRIDPTRPTMFPPPGPAGIIKGIFEARLGEIADIHYSFELIRDFNKTNVVKNPRTWTPTFETHTREELMKKGWSGIWFSSEYGITDHRSDALNAPYSTIIADVQEDPTSGKNSQQVFIDRLSREWGYMRDDPTCLGGAYFCWIAAGAGDPWGWTRWGEDADWGVVTGDLYPKPAFWAMRTIYSPVQISDKITWKPGETEIHVNVHNGYNSIDLSQCTLRTQWGMPTTSTWKDVPVSCAPGQSTMVAIPINKGNQNTLKGGRPVVCRCTVLDPKGYRPILVDIMVMPEK